jgi:rhodanese-related sulfurtransferase
VRHLPAALNVTAEHDDDVVRRALPDRDSSIVTYSTDGACTRGPELAARLLGLGYTDVGVLVEGIAGWEAAGHPVESGTPGQI